MQNIIKILLACFIIIQTFKAFTISIQLHDVFIATGVSFTTGLAAAKLGRLVPSQFVRCEHSHWKRVLRSPLRYLQFSPCAITAMYGPLYIRCRRRIYGHDTFAIL